MLSSSINQSEGEKMADETPNGIKTEIIFCKNEDLSRAKL